MKEAEPSPYKPVPIEVEFAPVLDTPDGTDPVAWLNECWNKAFGAELKSDMSRLRGLREQAHSLGCECRQCRSANLNQRRAIVRKWRGNE